jgi:hypothetical protein
MKKHRVAFALPALLLLIAPVLANPSYQPDYNGGVRTDDDMLVPFDASRRARVGMTRKEVLFSMQGRPDENLGEEIWIYWDFEAKGQAEGSPHTAMLVVFEGDRVKLIRLTDPVLVQRLVAQQRKVPVPTNAVAKR